MICEDCLSREKETLRHPPSPLNRHTDNTTFGNLSVSSVFHEIKPEYCIPSLLTYVHTDIYIYIYIYIYVCVCVYHTICSKHRLNIIVDSSISSSRHFKYIAEQRPFPIPFITPASAKLHHPISQSSVRSFPTTLVIYWAPFSSCFYFLAMSCLLAFFLFNKFYDIS